MKTIIHRKIYLITIIFFIVTGSSVLNASNSAITLTYRETTGEKSSKIDYSFEKVDNGYCLKVMQPGETFEVNSDANYRAQKIDEIDNKNSMQISIHRENNRLFFKGENKGKKIDKNIPIDEDPWYGTPIMLKGFVLSDRKTENCFFAMPETQSVMKFKLIKDKTEIIQVAGKEMNVIKVIMTFPDYRAAFWKSFYWYRLSDGLLVKTEVLQGPPGTPKTIGELIEEQNM